MLPQNSSRPEFWVVAGPNGSGKSTVYTDADIETAGRSIWIINPDMLAARIHLVEQINAVQANVAAVTRIEAWLRTSIAAHQTIGVETVLSTSKYRPLVEEAKRLGFRIRLVYVVLDRPEKNIERVRLRVKKGGHPVPEQKIVERYWRSLAQMPWFLDQADIASIYDNSTAELKLVAQKTDGLIEVYPFAPKVVIDAINTLATD